MAHYSGKRQRYNITMGFEIPAEHKKDYEIFRAAVSKAANELAQSLGVDAELQYLAIQEWIYPENDPENGPAVWCVWNGTAWVEKKTGEIVYQPKD